MGWYFTLNGEGFFKRLKERVLNGSKYGKNNKELECNVKMLTVATIANEATLTPWMQFLPPLTILVSYIFDVAGIK